MVGGGGAVRAGYARREITPPVGTYLTGYIGRPGPASKVHDELYASALVLDDGSTQAAIVCLDILGTDFERDAELRQQISKATGIDPANILIASSHTHAGPATVFLRRCGDEDEGYIRRLLSQTASAAKDARDSLAEAELSYVSTTSDMNQNRRAWVLDDGAAKSPTSGVTNDRELSAVIVDNGSGPPGVLFNYACHGVTLCADNTVVSADWIGAARSALEQSGKVGMSMFLQGCCGDIEPRRRGGFEDVEMIGSGVAAPLIEALPSAQPVAVDGIKVAWTSVDLDFLPPASEEELEQEISFRREEIDRKRAQGAKLMEMEAAQAMLWWAEDALRMVREGGGAPCIRVPVQAIRIGDVKIVCIPGEVFSEIGLDIKKLGGARTIVVGYANGDIGYIPTQEAFGEGGYEIESAYRYYGLKMIAPDSEARIKDAVNALLLELSE